MTERFECPFRRPSEEKPNGLKMGKAAHAIVEFGVETARERLQIDSLDKSRSDTNPDPIKGWRDALLGMSIDNTYRIAHPQIENYINNNVVKSRISEGARIPEIGKTVVADSRAIFNGAIDESIKGIESSWIKDIYRELDSEIQRSKPEAQNGKKLVQSGVETLFTTYDWLMGSISRKKPDISLEELIEILKNSYKPFISPMTSMHLDDSYALGLEINWFEPDVSPIQPIGFRDNQLPLVDRTVYHSKATQGSVADFQRVNRLLSVVDGCPALLSPRVTQPRYPNAPIPSYRNVIQGLYAQMNEALKRAV